MGLQSWVGCQQSVELYRNKYIRQLFYLVQVFLVTLHLLRRSHWVLFTNQIKQQVWGFKILPCKYNSATLTLQIFQIALQRW